MARALLPIDPALPGIVAALTPGARLVLEAPPGAGKTTRVPVALHEAGLTAKGQILVLQPRRIAARLAAARVADELGEKPGGVAGYQIRFEAVASERTKILFLTEALLTRRLLADPELKGVAAVLIDEFHERHLQGDLGLALLIRLQETARPDLALAVMSATLDGAALADFLGGCPVVRAEGRPFPVAIEHLGTPDDRPLERQVAGAVKRLGGERGDGLDGDALIFLPGAREIRLCADALAEYAAHANLEIRPLHGDLPADEQDAAVRPGAKRKLILSTNVAETSLTLPGVTVVIDAGLHRRPAHDPLTGLPRLTLEKISKASAAQRAGRAGRVRPGRCLRLYTGADFNARPERDPPEILRADLAELRLALALLVDQHPPRFPDPPPPAALAAAERLLTRLGALDSDGRITAEGRALAALPLHPRLGKLLRVADAAGCGESGAALAALLGERDILRESRAFAAGKSGGAFHDSDPLDRLERLERNPRLPALDAGAVRAVLLARAQLRRRVKPDRAGLKGEDRDLTLRIALLAAFSDRIAKRREPGGDRLLLAGGEGGVEARLDPASGVKQAGLMIACAAETRGGETIVRLASAIEAEWLIEVAPEALTETTACEWNPRLQRVEAVTRLSCDAIALEETRRDAPADGETAAVLARAAREAGLDRFIPPENRKALAARLATAARLFPEAGFPAGLDGALLAAIEAGCMGLRSFKELNETDWLARWLSELPPTPARLLRNEFPEKFTLPGARTLAVNYESDRPPWIESRLQDFFGLAKGPAIADGRQPLVLHLLAPNQRAVQVTTDLANFWAVHYPKLRPQLSRDYPKHFWPENPATAKPPPPNRLKPG